jgi:uncharacterized membrane protein
MSSNQVAAPAAVKPARSSSRLFAIDALRGLCMAVMALDHANLLIAQKHPPSENFGGAFPVFYDGLTFITRFLTQFAPAGFFLLMGVGMVLFALSRMERGWTKRQVITHFCIRGAVLIAMQLLIVNRGWEIQPGGWGIPIYVGVLVALGANMILGSLYLWLKPGVLLAIAAVAAIGAELAVPDPSVWAPNAPLLQLLLFYPGGIVPEGQPLLAWISYPILAWTELAALGMALGHWLADDPKRAFSRAWKVGLGFLAAFAVIRYLDGFGNLRPRMGNSIMDWFTLVKYPPSLAFSLLTTGVNLILIWALSRAGELAQRALQPLRVFGRTPLFFYVLHVFLYVLIGTLVSPRGMPVAQMYPYWLLGLALLLPACWWYGRLKARQSATSALRFL